MHSRPNDPVSDEIRELRHRISERVDHDPQRLVAYYLELQKYYGDRLVAPAKSTERKDQPAA